VGEGDIIDLLIMAGISQLGSNIISIAPVNCGLIGTTEEMSGVSGKRQRGNSSHYFSKFLNVEIEAVYLGNHTISSTKKEVTIGKKLDALDTLGE